MSEVFVIVSKHAQFLSPPRYIGVANCIELAKSMALRHLSNLPIFAKSWRTKPRLAQWEGDNSRVEYVVIETNQFYIPYSYLIHKQLLAVQSDCFVCDSAHGYLGIASSSRSAKKFIEDTSDTDVIWRHGVGFNEEFWQGNSPPVAYNNGYVIPHDYYKITTDYVIQKGVNDMYLKEWESYTREKKR